MRLGIDFDNTIVCYDQVFHRAALERGWITADVPVQKDAVRDHLRARGNESLWTELQGHVYGERMAEATAFPGALETLTEFAQAGIELCIISHKTRYPAKGPRADLHAAALEWVRRNGLLERLNLSAEHGLYFEITRADKLARIRSCGCTHFIDDLPEVLSEPGFPEGVARILFDPGAKAAGADSRWQRAESWPAIARLIRAEPVDKHQSAIRNPQSVPAVAVSELLRQAGGAGAIQALDPLPVGGNNQVYRVESEGRKYLLKAYFRHPRDPRDRLGTEFGFLRFAWENGLRQVPQPFVSDAVKGWALYEFIDGRRLQPAELDPACVSAALDFILALNAHRSADLAKVLPAASEACFSIENHIACAERRMQRVQTIVADTDVTREALAFVREQLVPEWERIRADIRRQSADAGLDLAAELPNSERIISPSDFGFHNALQAPGGRLVFIDFEYGGWDDPAKLASDFFLQPAMPPPRSCRDPFLRGLASLVADAKRFICRAGILRPLYGIKWCCILLNEFLPVDRQRRAFADREMNLAARQRKQLEKAREMLRHTTDAAAL